ncbi:MAG: hypothetical protein M1819_005705 [Sarea resinae]|nr:MAG: hypothetical protein M1819_005705 [Sarea resinae]
MFSNLNQSKPAGSSLFGNLGGSSQAQSQPGQTSSLFGANPSQPQQQPQQSSLFSLGGDTKPQSSSNLFAGMGQSQQPQQQPQQPASGGLFGASTAQSNQPAQSSLFGAQANQPAQQPLGSSILGSTQTQQNQGAQSQQKQNTPIGSQPAYFESLLERGRKRNDAVDNGNGFGELPSLQLGLGDIARRVREMGGAAPTQQGKRVDSKAHYLLAASGISPISALRDLNSLGVPLTGASSLQAPPAFDTDIEGYVANLQSQSTLAMIAEGLNRSARDFDAFLEENVTMEWDAQRRRIYEHFGLAPKGADRQSDSIGSPRTSSPAAKGGFGRSTRRGRGQGAPSKLGASAGASVFGASGMQKSVIGAPGTAANATLFADVADKEMRGSPGVNDRFLREKEGMFAEKVQRFNEARLQEKSYPVLGEFSHVEGHGGSETTPQLIDAYQALIEIVNEKPASEDLSDPNTVRERQFADEYLDETPNSAKTIAIRKRIIDGSRRFLEKQFYQQIEALIAKNPREANLGGVPTTINKVRAYIRVRTSRRDLMPENGDLQMLGDDYCWVLIFYLLRSGLVKEAAEYVISNTGAFRTIDRNFVTYIASYANRTDRRLARSLQDRVNTEYQQRARIAPDNSIDPYRMACYKLIGRCELNKRSLEGITQGVEDWIWLQFNLAREVNRVEEVASEVFGLEEVRVVIREIGQRHFARSAETSGGFGTYFLLQILGGMFEHAVSFLYPQSYVSAVHFAIALDYYGLLRVSDLVVSDSELLTFNTKQLPQISFGRMLGYYTRDFRSANVSAAVDYLALICLNSDLPGQGGKSQSSLCHEALRELVLETREFAQLLGDIRSDGHRIKGAIEQRLKLIKLADQEEFLRTVTMQAAAVADDNGRTTDAVLLYHLAEEYDNVISIINRALSDAVSTDLGQESVKLVPLKPRSATAIALQPSQQPSPQANTSLSLTSVDDPTLLARNMITLYNSNALYYRKIPAQDRDACGVLLRMSEARSKVEAGKWAEALDIISTLSLLPLTANGSIPLIRSHATTFNSLAPVLARTIGPLLTWTITCCARQREILLSSPFYADGAGKAGVLASASRGRDAGEAGMAERLLTTAKDLMVFAGLIRYRLTAGVFERLAAAGGEVGVGVGAY